MIKYPKASKLTLYSDFTGVSKLLQVRPPFTPSRTQRAYLTIFLWPITAISLTWILASALFLGLQPVQHPLLLVSIGGLRVVALLVEFYMLAHQFQRAEFDEWYSGLYDQKVKVHSHDFYIHFRPWITCSLLILGCISWVLLAQISHLPAIFNAIDPLLTIAAGEPVHLLTRWLLELYSRTPAEFNIPLWLATFPDKQHHNMLWYFDRFYAKSRLTRLVEAILSRITATFLSVTCIQVEPESDSVQGAHPQLSSSSRPSAPESIVSHFSATDVAVSLTKMQKLGVEPWAMENSIVFRPSNLSCEFLSPLTQHVLTSCRQIQWKVHTAARNYSISRRGLSTFQVSCCSSVPCLYRNHGVLVLLLLGSRCSCRL